MKATAIINNSEKMYYRVLDIEGEIFISFFAAEYDDPVPVEYDELDYAVEYAGPFVDARAANSFGTEMVLWGTAEHESKEVPARELFPQNWQEMIEADTEYQLTQPQTPEDYWGSPRPY